MSASIWHSCCLQSFNMNSKRTCHLNICATFFRHLIDITHPFFSQWFIMGKRFSSEVISGLCGSIFCQCIKKSMMTSLIYEDKILLRMLTIALTKTESTQFFSPFSEKGCHLQIALISKRF